MERIYKKHYNIEGIEFDIHIFYNWIQKIDEDEYIHHFVIALERDNPISSNIDYQLLPRNDKLIEFFEFPEMGYNNKKQLPGNTLQDIMYILFSNSKNGQMSYKEFCLYYEFEKEDVYTIDWYRESKCTYAKMERLFSDKKESSKIHQYFLKHNI